MARSLSQAIMTRATTTSLSYSTSRLLPARHRSSGPVLPPHRTSDADRDSDSDWAAIRKLEDAVHRIIVQRSQPDWLPFRPGSSYWVPPKSKSRGFAKVIRKLANSVSVKDPAMAIGSSRGWPSSVYYFKGAAPATREVETSSKHPTQSEDEES